MHLVVVQHGLWGYPSNTAHLSSLLREALGNGGIILNSGVNSGNLTYDGIDVCGDRLVALVHKTMECFTKSGNPVTAISLVGYSMGGLVIRYAAGKLYAEGVFASVVPVNFITVATPHLGAWRMPSSFYNRAFNFMVPVVTSRSGYQLVLQDKHLWGKPLLCLMSHPDLLFMRALRIFKKLMLLANVFHDRPVPYCTAAIRLDNPYELSPPVPIDPKYPSIVTTAAAAAAAVAAAAAATASKSACDPAAAAAETAVQAVAVGTAARAALRPADGGGSQNNRNSSKDESHEVVTVAEPPPGATAAAAEPPPLRPLRSTYMPLLMVFFLPLALPALLLMVVTGRTHHCKIARTALDFSWIQRHSHSDRQHQRRVPRQESLGDAAGASPLPHRGLDAPVGAMAGGNNAEHQRGTTARPGGDGGDCEGQLPSDIECPAAPDLPSRRSTSKSLVLAAGTAAPPPQTLSPAGSATAPAAAGGGGGACGGAAGVTVAPASSTALGALDDGDDGVVVSEQNVLLHDGIVELPGELHRVQEWLVDQLNQLPWHKVDVDCRDFHAHAAIIMRNPARFKHNRDVLDYLVGHFLRA